MLCKGEETVSRKSSVTVVGTGYVGLSLSTLLARHHNVIALDINISRIDQVNARISPIGDTAIENIFKNETLSLVATRPMPPAILYEL